MYVLLFTSVTKSRITVHFAVWPKVFKLEGDFETNKCIERPKMTSTLVVQRYMMCYANVKSQISLHFTLQHHCFQVKAGFETSAPNDLECYKIKGTPYLCY